MISESSQSFVQFEADELAERKSSLRGPDFWAGDLTRLETLHAQISKALLDNFLTQGWPTIPAVGWDEAMAAIRVVTRCISKPHFMLQCLPLVEQAYRFGGIPGEWFAEIYDTIMYFKNKPQIFGTFLDWDKNLNVAAWQILEIDKLDQRRALFGLGPFAEEYTKQIARWNDTAPTPPVDYRSYFQARELWAERVGWVDLRSGQSGLPEEKVL